MHIIHGQIRIPQRYGGDPDVTQEIWVCNDTGSSTLSIFNSDLTALGFDPKWWYANSGHRTKIVVLVSAQSHSRDVSIEICCSCSSYIGHSSSHYCSSANGLVWLAHVSIEMQVLTSASVPLTPWFEQLAVVKQWGPNEARLSGDGMRDHLFFATSPGNRNLYVSTRKAGLMRVLPA
ncbi:unnamed protein product [Penicillium salamii]|uniref:Uncharacterized protein n=1 Tax=Penicillium salamii TaxID=1612424 RepID=A0A9W4K1B2_9EURO|nr:unnamed protein product [Penicillium salamii]CAG8334962.1 unnamed protein product [Penicillium salamii]CAG8359209.1 unnamed protein product [Penicillium salamii]CAG8372496.1 unnamed protein product [Penicillium salamii]CAG8397513.1 unnamed protein product [Penicillium salamii]